MSAYRPGILNFTCNICGHTCSSPMEQLSREQPSCPNCGSTVRMRGMIHALSIALFQESRVLSDFPNDKSIKGVGLSDWIGYADPLSQKLDYENTYYHQEPMLDIMIAPEVEGTYDFLFSSDVFEHVPPPAFTAFQNSHSYLKKNGSLVFSVPYNNFGETLEHFPDLNEYFIDYLGDKPILKNLTKNGLRQEFNNLVFHGGAGETLEMRVFSLPSLTNLLLESGFQSINVVKDPCFRFGVFWPQTSSLPIIAKKGTCSLSAFDWGPKSLKTRKGLFKSSSGEEAVWFTHQALAHPDQIDLYIGEEKLPNSVTVEETTSAYVPDRLRKRPGYYPLLAKYSDEDKVFIGEILFND